MRYLNRIESALRKLYVAFNENQLHPECCEQCAVGNILDKTDNWKYLSDHHGSVELNYIGNVPQSIGRKFNGLCALVKFLCELDNIPDAMWITQNCLNMKSRKRNW